MAFNSNLTGRVHYVARAMSQLIPKGNIYTLRGDDWSTIEWDENNPDSCPTEAEVAKVAEELRVKDEYRLPRKKNYPNITDQLDMIYHDQVNGTNTFKDAIEAVKKKYPKG
jgi:hypothetical protein